MEADLFLVFLFVGAVILGPLDDVLHLSDLNLVFLQDLQEIFVVKPLSQGVHIGLCPQADALEASGFCRGNSLLESALIPQSPGTDSDRIFFRHGCFLLVWFL